MIQLLCHGHDIDPHSLRPIMQISPGQFTFDRAIHRHESVARFFELQTMKCGIPARQLLFEKEIVEVAVEQVPSISSRTSSISFQLRTAEEWC